MNVVAIIQARTGSTRLPNKVLFNLGDCSILEWVIRRVRQFLFLDQLVLATTAEPEDDSLAALARELECLVFRVTAKLDDGRNDVLLRTYYAACMVRADVVVRITADCPFVSHDLAQEVWARYCMNNSYTANVTTNLDGFDVEIFPFSQLELIHTTVTDLNDRHHVTPAMRRLVPPGGSWFVSQPYAEGVKLSVDTMADYERLRRIVRGGCTLGTEWPTIVAAAQRLMKEER